MLPSLTCNFSFCLLLACLNQILLPLSSIILQDLVKVSQCPKGTKRHKWSWIASAGTSTHTHGHRSPIPGQLRFLRTCLSWFDHVPVYSSVTTMPVPGHGTHWSRPWFMDYFSAWPQLSLNSTVLPVDYWAPFDLGYSHQACSWPVVTFLAWPQPGFITTDLAVPHLHKSIWRPGLQADPSCNYPAWLPVLWGAAGSHRLLTLTGEYILSPVAQRKARTIRKVELGCAGLVPFPHARMAVSLLILQTSLRV